MVLLPWTLEVCYTSGRVHPLESLVLRYVAFLQLLLVLFFISLIFSFFNCSYSFSSSCCLFALFLLLKLKITVVVINCDVKKILDLLLLILRAIRVKT